MTPPVTGKPPGSPPYLQHTSNPPKRNSGFADCTAAHPLRRELLAGGSAGTILPDDAASTVTGCIDAWKEAAQTHLEAEHRYAAASEAVEASRVGQVVKWLGDEFDGALVFDEAHAMANAAGGKGQRGEAKPSQQGRAGLHLQNALPGARVLYVSASLGELAGVYPIA